jgi:hypothetical protein
MKISIHQPTYWPWLGLLDKIAKSDLFVILDNVQVSKGSFQYRNQFLCNGSAKFITLPVKIDSNTNFTKLQFKNNNWRDQQLSFLRNYYQKAKYFKIIFPQLENFYQNFNGENASDLIVETMLKSFDFFEIDVKIERASNYKFSESKGNLVYEICSFFKANTYISGQGAKQYMDETLINKFKENNIHIEWQHFHHPKYNQLFNNSSFIEGLSCLDMLFHNGIDLSRQIFKMNSLKMI